MTKIKVSYLQPGPQMDALVARARMWVHGRAATNEDGFFSVWYKTDGSFIKEEEYNPSGNGGQAMELVKEFKVSVLPTRELWEAGIENLTMEGYGLPFFGYGETPEIAICRAVIAARFGDEVETN